MLAGFIDLLLVGFVTGLISSTQSTAAGFAVATIISTLFVWTYFAACESSVGATPGKLALSLRVADLEGNLLSFPRAFYRAFIRALSVGAFLLGELWMFFDDRERAWHDIATDSEVRLSSERIAA